MTLAALLRAYAWSRELARAVPLHRRPCAAPLPRVSRRRLAAEVPLYHLQPCRAPLLQVSRQQKGLVPTALAHPEAAERRPPAEALPPQQAPLHRRRTRHPQAGSTMSHWWPRCSSTPSHQAQRPLASDLPRTLEFSSPLREVSRKFRRFPRCSSTCRHDPWWPVARNLLSERTVTLLLRAPLRLEDPRSFRPSPRSSSTTARVSQAPRQAARVQEARQACPHRQLSESDFCLSDIGANSAMRRRRRLHLCKPSLAARSSSRAC
mmetsp:Transcript_47471/g.112881  ORF Transcript_47471/g.112881 Transcript_47471/m.112881 type:complete len:264 (-) Transcript_47471:146-937(-)